MGNVIQTNVSSLGAQRTLGQTNEALSTTFKRLSTGLRINSAKDDAAGLQISNQLTSQINGLGVASRNANDGISMAQTAEGALQETTNLLQRMRDLSIQSANGSNSSSQRNALQAEVTQIQAEVNRIADTTAFGGRNLLDGSFGSSSFQVGSQAFETINLSIGNFSGASIGNQRLDLNSAAGAAAVTQYGSVENNTAASTTAVSTAGGALTISGDATAAVTIAGASSAFTAAAAINTQTGTTGVTADARTVVSLAFTANETFTFNLTGSNTTAVSVQATTGAAGDVQAMADAINERTGQTGITAVVDSGEVKLTSERGDDIILDDVSATANTSTIVADVYNYTGETALTGATDTATADTATDGLHVVGTIRLSSDKGYTATAAAATINGTAGTYVAALDQVSDVNISTQIGAQTALDVIDSALTKIDSSRADLGAIQNRLTSTISNLGNIIENVSAARSRVRDTDFASETANLAKNQVLQQAGLSILAQANASSQSVLSLLQ
jgi:flagellin